jgi:hypothetical protein
MLGRISTLSINIPAKDKEPSIYIDKIKHFLDEKNNELRQDAIQMGIIADELEHSICENRSKILELETIKTILTDDLNEKNKNRMDNTDVLESIEIVDGDIKELKELLRSQETVLYNSQKEWDRKKAKLVDELNKIWDSITVYIDNAKKDIESITSKLKNTDGMSSSEILAGSNSQASNLDFFIDTDIESIDSSYDLDELKSISPTDSVKSCKECENIVCTCLD